MPLSAALQDPHDTIAMGNSSIPSSCRRNCQCGPSYRIHIRLPWRFQPASRLVMPYIREQTPVVFPKTPPIIGVTSRASLSPALKL